MLAIVRWMGLRFLRLGLWVPALIVPLVVLGVVVFAADPAFPLAGKVLVDLLVYLLPVLAIVTVLAAVRRRQWALDLTRPLGLPGLLAAIWIGGTLPFLVCHAAIVAVAVAATWLLGGNAGAPPAAEFHRDVRFWRGTPSRRLGGAPGDGFERLEWLAQEAPWTFEVRGIDPGEHGDAPLAASIIAEVGLAAVERTADARGEPVRAPVLYRSRDVAAVVRFEDDEDRERSPPVRLELLDRERVPLEIPRRAVLGDGRLLVVIEIEREATEEHGHGGDPAEEGGPRRQGEPADDGHRHTDPEGEIVLWFSPDSGPGTDGAWRPIHDERRRQASGLLVVRRQRPFHASLLRLGVLAAGLLPLATAMATFAAACFGPAVAFAFNITVFTCGVSMGFLREIVGSLSLYSAAVILGDPLEQEILRRPGWFDRALEKLLEFWLVVLPDFRPYHGADAIYAGDLMGWAVIGKAYATTLLYAACFLAAAAALLWRAGIDRSSNR